MEYHCPKKKLLSKGSEPFIETKILNPANYSNKIASGSQKEPLKAIINKTIAFSDHSETEIATRIVKQDTYTSETAMLI